MALDALQWPTPDDYTTAMDNLNQLAVPEWLRKGKVERDGFDNIHTFTGAGLYTCTYKVQLEPSAESPSGHWMARCFCSSGNNHPPEDIRRRYSKISDFCNSHLYGVSVLLPVQYVEQALRVLYIDEHTQQPKGDKVVPIILMPFVDNALPLGTYIALNYQERERMEELCRAWLTMLQQMHQVQVAHGDLDLTNVLVQEKGNSLYLKLIDYDNMWIPALKNFPQTELGHDGFQHPILAANKSRPYDVTMDRFSALSIYISIRALSFYPELYRECKANDTHNLLFAREDYLKEINRAHSSYLPSTPTDIGTIAKLKSKNNPLLTPYLVDLCYSLYYDCMPNYNVYDIPPNLGEYGMPEPPHKTTTIGVAPVTPVPTSRQASQTQQTAMPPSYTSRPTPTPPYRPQRRQGNSAIFIVIAVIIIVLIALVIGIYLYIQAHNPTPSHSQILLPLFSKLYRWKPALSIYLEWNMV